MKTTNKRYIWIDIARLFSMFMIITGHIPCYENEILSYITTFHVAIFFILSGYLYHPQTFKNEMKKSFKSLIVPYFILGLINCFYWSILYTCVEKISIISNFEQFTIELLTFSIGLPMIGPLWFLVVLFLLRITMIKSLNMYTFLFYSLICCMVAYLINVYFPDSMFFAPLDYFLALPFFTIGFIMQKNDKFVERILVLPPTFKIFLLCISLVLSLMIFQYQGGNNMSKHDYGVNIITFYICAVCGSLGIFIFSSLLSIKSLQISKILHITNNGLPLMIGLQILMIDIVKHITHIYAFHITSSFIISIVIIIIIYPLTILSMKSFPLILGKRK